jgi:hypothetical protein
MTLTFVIVSAICSLALFFLLSYYRFRLSPEDRYFSWLRNRFPIVIKPPWIERLKEFYGAWFLMRYPANQRLIFLGLAASYLYLVLSGFVFAFAGVRLFGFFLLLHVVLGALFAVCLCLAVVLRARYYVWREEDGAAANLKTREGKRKAWQILTFWVFTASGLILVSAALGQMLPSFSLRAQLTLFEFHRYAALGILLAGIAFWYFSYGDEGP